MRWSRAAAHGFGLRSVVFLPFCSLFRVLLTEMNRAEQSRGAESKRSNFVHARKQRIRANEPNRRTETEQKRRADQQAKGKEQKEFWWSDVFALVLCSCADLVLAAVSNVALAFLDRPCVMVSFGGTQHSTIPRSIPESDGPGPKNAALQNAHVRLVPSKERNKTIACSTPHHK